MPDKARTDDDAIFADLLREEAEAPDPGFDMAPEDWLSFLLFWLLAGVVFLQFFTRYVLNDSVAWTEEIARYILMALTFTGSATAARRGSHITVEFLPAALRPESRRWLEALSGGLTVSFFAVSVWLCWQVAEAMRFQPMVVIDWPLAYVYWTILAGLVLTTLRAAQTAISRFRSGAPAPVVRHPEDRAGP